MQAPSVILLVHEMDNINISENEMTKQTILHLCEGSAIICLYMFSNIHQTKKCALFSNSPRLKKSCIKHCCTCSVFDVV